MKPSSALLLLLVGCARAGETDGTPTKPPLPVLISHSGASLYIFRGWDDAFDDGSSLFNVDVPREESDYEKDPNLRQGQKGVLWCGDTALRLILRNGPRLQRLELVATADFMPVSGQPFSVTLFDPDPLKTSGDSAVGRLGFRIQLRPSIGKNPGRFALEWEVEKLIDVPGTEDRVSPGDFKRIAERVHVGSGVLPFESTLIWFSRETEGKSRGHFIILRVASLLK